MVRHDHIEFLGQRVIERQTVERPDIMMQDQDRPAAPAARHTQLDLAQFDCLLVPPDGHNSSFYSTTPAPAYRPDSPGGNRRSSIAGLPDRKATNL